MLLVPYTIAPSPYHGLGVFAVEDIAADTFVYSFHPKVGRAFSTAADVLSLPLPAQRFYYHPLWKSKYTGAYCFHGGDAEIINHSDTPNLEVHLGYLSPEYSATAIRDIKAGEELFWNYKDFDDIDLSPGNLFETIRKNTGIDPDAYDDHIELGKPLPK